MLAPIEAIRSHNPAQRPPAARPRHRLGRPTGTPAPTPGRPEHAAGGQAREGSPRGAPAPPPAWRGGKGGVRPNSLDVLDFRFFYQKVR